MFAGSSLRATQPPYLKSFDVPLDPLIEIRQVNKSLEVLGLHFRLEGQGTLGAVGAVHVCVGRLVWLA